MPLMLDALCSWVRGRGRGTVISLERSHVVSDVGLSPGLYSRIAQVCTILNVFKVTDDSGRTAAGETYATPGCRLYAFPQNMYTSPLRNVGVPAGLAQKGLVWFQRVARELTYGAPRVRT